MRNVASSLRTCVHEATLRPHFNCGNMLLRLIAPCQEPPSKKQNKKELAIQANLEGESLNAAAKEKEEQLERQRKLREKKQKLKEALENEQKLKDEKEKQRRA